MWFVDKRGAQAINLDQMKRVELCNRSIVFWYASESAVSVEYEDKEQMNAAYAELVDRLS